MLPKWWRRCASFSQSSMGCFRKHMLRGSIFPSFKINLHTPFERHDFDGWSLKCIREFQQWGQKLCAMPSNGATILWNRVKVQWEWNVYFYTIPQDLAPSDGIAQNSCDFETRVSISMITIEIVWFKIRGKIEWNEGKITPDGTRTRNLWLRKPTP